MIQNEFPQKLSASKWMNPINLSGSANSSRFEVLMSVFKNRGINNVSHIYSQTEVELL